MEYRIKKYTFFEGYPSILKHKIPIISMLICFVYLDVLIFYWIKSFNFKFYKFKKNVKINGATSEINFPLTSKSIQESSFDKIIDIKKRTVSTYITFYKRGTESIEKVKELLKDGTISSELKELLPHNKNFSIRAEIVTIFDESEDSEYKKDVILITKGYNIAAIKTLKLFSFLTEESQNNFINQVKLFFKNLINIKKEK